MVYVHNLVYPVRSEATAFRIIDGEAVILNLDNGVYYSLDEVGAKVWDLCDGSNSIKDIIMVICEEFEVKGQTAGEDILEFMEELLKESLVVINENPTQVKSD